MIKEKIMYLPSANGLSKKDFKRLASFIQEQVGILMPDSKHSLLTARLQKRLRTLKMSSFSDYVDWILNPKHSGEEIVNFLDLVTTNKTDFFREPAHFDFLTATALPALMEKYGAGSKRPLQIWSAPCSSGEEPYTLAIVAMEFAKSRTIPNYQVKILGSDLSTKALKKGYEAVYEKSKVDGVPLSIKKEYMLKSKNKEKPTVRIGPKIRSMVTFHHLNFMDANYNIANIYDIIFCRNCLIYFDRVTSENIVNKLCNNLQPGGYFFIGHAETLNGIDVPVKQVAPTIYQKPYN
ncbi:MAG: protein-glutamate O-methyltransferase CheR [Magnetococcales bacterium]|nr:protein-glutamate O-methyltransferase CheR [Magnetococcales bacterium]